MATGWLSVTSLQQDFAAYWVAGAARNAGLDPYVNHVGGPAAPGLWDGVAVFAHSRFLYPPLVADLFRPLAHLPYATAKMLFTALGLAAWVVASALAARAVGAARGFGIAVGAGALSYPLYLHLERGQIDLLVLVLLLIAFAARERTWPAAVALAVAVTFKPALVLLLPVVAALGRWRAAAAAVAGIAGVALLTAAVSGPALLREYVTEVLPRAALYGEGGTRSMLLPDERFPPSTDVMDAPVSLDGRDYRLQLWDRPASASVSRLLAPEEPSRAVNRLTALGFAAALVAAARAVRRRGSPVGEALIFWAGAIACVVASPAGWVMGLVWALPLVPWLARLRGAPGTSRPAWWGVALTLAACAIPPPIEGWPALAGTAVVVATIVLALSRREIEAAA